VLGTAPNRRFVVSWFQVPYYSCWSTLITAQVKLYESTNCIEILMGDRQLCAGWNGGYGIEGIQDAIGSSALAVAGRNYPTAWTATNDAYQISPTCAPCNNGNSCLVVLPVELLDFTAQAENDRVRLQWNTSSENNNDYFTVEKTIDGFNYEQVAIVDGAGTSTQQHHYETFDLHPYIGTSYYRLKQTDFNGMSKYYSPVAVEFTGNGNFAVNVYPVPADASELNIALFLPADSPVRIEIYDLVGKLLDSKSVLLGKGSDTIKLNEQDKLAPGVYIVRTFTDKTFAENRVVIK
ncbi:MAG TPA: T9SS type A sorting domain-containing protein, partial [Bacteroidia bacterium]|nr:T9SS type A sorting domain-containing protein [Bacteroidia bacterium]